MRKLGILIGIIAVATLGFTGTASADGHEAELCPGIDGATQPLVDGGAPIPETQDGLVETCETSNSADGLHLSPTLCGLNTDVTELGVPGEVPKAINDGIVEDGNLDFDGPPLDFDACPDGGGNGGGDNTGDNGDNNGNGGGGPEVLGNGAADGGLPRTGGELFAGAGFGLASLGALIRRFIG